MLKRNSRINSVEEKTGWFVTVHSITPTGDQGRKINKMDLKILEGC